MNIDEINELIEIMKDNNLKLLEASYGGRRYKMEFYDCYKENKQSKAKQVPGIDDVKIISSPLVGVAYRSSAPNEKAFIEVSECAKIGDTVCIIEAMKVLNEIQVEEDCEIIEVCFKDGDVVEFGQPLFKIRSRGAQCFQKS